MQRDDVEQERGGEPELSRRRFLGALSAVVGVGAVGAQPLMGEDGALAEEQEEAGLGSAGSRLRSAYRKRLASARSMLGNGMPAQEGNGDEALHPSRIGNYTKGLPHDPVGEVDPGAYEALLGALRSGDPDDFERIPLAGRRKLVNPQAGLAYELEGYDPQQLAMPPAPALGSAEAAGEMVELYWMALLRDVPFERYAGDPLVLAAARELSSLSDFRGPREGSEITPQTLFREGAPGGTAGPYISQFLLRTAPFGAEHIRRRVRTLAPGSDRMTDFDEWRRVQDGEVPGRDRFDPTLRYIRNGRDLSQWVHVDVLFQAYFNACLILGSPPDPDDPVTGGGLGCPVNSGNPYRRSTRQDGFGTWGPPAFKSLVCEVATRALKAVWFQKWFVHRRLRPEEYGGRVHLHRSRLAEYPLHPDVLESEALDRVLGRHGSHLLPMAFAEGSPMHPAYGAGHATVAGACVTVLKALFDEDFEIQSPVVPADEGRRLQPWSGTETLTVGGELNKLAANVAVGRNHAGVHWRSDATQSLRLGEKVAMAVLLDHQRMMNEGGRFRFTTFDGERVVL